MATEKKPWDRTLVTQGTWWIVLQITIRYHMIIDCFTYNNEEEMLNFRLHELNQIVDKFVLVESPFTHQGSKKKTSFEDQKSKFIKFRDKIIHVVHDLPPHPNPWINEKHLRNAAGSGIKRLSLSSKDYIGISDVDEIPDPDILFKMKSASHKGYIGFMHNFYYYNVNCRKRNKWYGSVFGDVASTYYDYNFELNELRFELKRNNPSIKVVGQNRNFNAGGWHFSYFGTINQIVEKLESFTHREFNLPEYKDINYIKNAVKNGKDLFARGGAEDTDIIQETYLPKRIDLLPNLFV
jgi:beta-1,4-mannosyl-glycoprotein beta-1,4-N-acetylglucosaminyltransferase